MSDQRNRLTRLPSLRGFAAISLVVLTSLSSPAPAHDFKAGDITVDHPWSRATPPAAKVASGFATIRNAGSQADRLLSASGEIAGKSEIHEMAVDANGVMTMRPLMDGVEIPAGATVELKPGAIHLMLMELGSRPKEGEKFNGTLTFAKAGTINVVFDVQAMGQGHSGHGDH